MVAIIQLLMFGLVMVAFISAACAYVSLIMLSLHGAIRAFLVMADRELSIRERVELGFMSTSAGIAEGTVVYLAGVALAVACMIAIGGIAVLSGIKEAETVAVLVDMVRYVDFTRLLDYSELTFTLKMWWGIILFGAVGYTLYGIGRAFGLSEPEQSSLERIGVINPFFEVSGK